MLQTKTFSIGDFAWQSWSNSYVLDLIITEESTDLNKNESLIKYRLQLRSGINNNFEDYLSCSVEINGVEVEKRIDVPIDAYFNHTYVLIEGETSVAHDSDGKKNLPVVGKIWGVSDNQWAPPDMTINESMQLTAIPRAGGISCTDAFIESTANITITNFVPSFGYNIAFEFGGLKKFLDSNGNWLDSPSAIRTNNIPFPFLPEMYSYIPNSRSGWGTVTCYTYNGPSLVGNPSTSKFTAMTLEDRCRPEVSGSVEDINPDTVSLTGNSSSLVRYRSTARCTISETARNGAKIASHRINGLDFSGNFLDIPQVESGNVNFLAVDSRGYQNTFTSNNNVVPYIPITCNVSARRDTPTGDTLTITVYGDCYQGSFGTVDNTVSVSYSVAGGASGAIPVDVKGNEYKGTINISGISYDQEYYIAITASDKLDTVQTSVSVGKGKPIIGWSPGLVEVDGDFISKTIHRAAFGSMYVSGNNFLDVKSKFENFDGDNQTRGTIFVFGNYNGNTVIGAVTFSNAGDVSWKGTEQITVSTEENGVIRIGFPGPAFDWFYTIQI